MEAVIKMINKITVPSRIFLGELLIERMEGKLLPEEIAQCQEALYEQKIFTNYFIHIKLN